MIEVHGRLVEIEARDVGDKTYRTAFILDGRHVLDLGVAKDVNGELDELMGEYVVAEARYSVKWFDTAEGRRPGGRLVLVGVRGVAPVPVDDELSEAA